MTLCPYCNGAGMVPDDLNDMAADRLRAMCTDAGIVVGIDDTVSESDAATLLNRAPRTLHNWRHCGGSLEWQRVNGRYRYTLEAIARWLIENEEGEF